MERGFYFETPNNTYFYDDETGYVQHCDEKKEGAIYGEKSIYKECNKEEVKKYIENNGFKHLILMVTQDCNLRCKYCAYSGEYANQREHTKLKMSFEVAKKGIDKYYEAYCKTRKNDFSTLPAIGFYGGEPLLEFDLMKKTVAYIKEVFKENVCLLVTTNGTIMDEEIAKFLIDNDFHVTVSLNGDKKENDRMRVYINGKGTYDDIYKNLMLIKNMDEKYYKSNLSLSAVYDWGTDLGELEQFHEENKDILPKFARCSMVLDYFTDWYEHYTKEDAERFVKSNEKLFESYLKKIKTEEEEKISKLEGILVAQPLISIFNRTQGIGVKETKTSFLPYSGTCVTYSKVAIAPDGTIHCCEKINLARPIGDVDNWIDMDKVCALIDDYNKVIMPKCSDCPIQRLCQVCYTACLDDNGNFVDDNIKDCTTQIEYYKDMFSKAYTLLEEGYDVDLVKMMGGK